MKTKEKNKLVKVIMSLLVAIITLASVAFAATDISTAMVVFSDMKYTGEAIESTPVVTLDEHVLIRGIDYSVEYANNIESGVATGTIIGIGNYTGTVKGNFLIYVNKTEINVTGLQTATSSSHDCNNYKVDKYDTTSHWQECSICSNEYVNAGRPIDASVWTNKGYLEVVTNDSGKRVLAIRNSYATHSYTTDYWTIYNSQGNPSCSDNNYHIFICNCGHSYQTQEGKPEHGNSELLSNMYYHCYVCLDCMNEVGTQDYHVFNGTTKGCMESGICDICNMEVPAAHNGLIHVDPYKNTSSSYFEQNCPACGKKIFKGNGKGGIVDATISQNGINYSGSIKVYLENNVTEILGMWLYEDGYFSRSKNNITYNGLENGNTMCFSFSGNFIDSNSEIFDRIQIGTRCATNNGENVFYGLYVNIYPSAILPTFNVTENYNTTNGWKTGYGLTVSGTEQYYSSVIVEMVDNETGAVVHTANVTVDKNSKTFTHTFFPNIATGESGKVYSIRVRNTFGEAIAKNITISNTDVVPPTAAKDSQLDSEGIWSTPTAWSKLKDFIITATDEGSQIVDIKFQDVNNAGTGYNFTDNFGITSMDITKDPVTNNREYTFTGDVTGYVTAAVYLVDAAGNEKTEYLRIYNLDNTAPVINMADTITSVNATANITDAGSGLRYFAVTYASQTNAPTIFGNIDTTTGNTINQWYRVANSSDTNPEDASARNVNVTFNKLMDGRYTFWAMDMLGNISKKDFEVEARTYIEKTEIDVTGLQTATSSSHDCNNYKVDKYDTTSHWKECSICSNEYVSAGRPIDASVWTNKGYLEVITNDSGERVLAIKGTLATHNYSNNYWTVYDENGNPSCSEYNWHVFLCNCGYSYQTQEGKPEHAEIFMNANNLYHILDCKKCYTYAEKNTPENHIINGKERECMEAGVCDICNNYLPAEHHTSVRVYATTGQYSNLTCNGCGQKIFADDSKSEPIDLNITRNGQSFSGTIKLHMEYDVTEVIQNIMHETGYYRLLKNEVTYTGIENGNTLCFEFSGNYPSNVVTDFFDTMYFIVRFNNSNGESIVVAMYVEIPPSAELPTFNVTENYNTVNGWKTGYGLTVSGTEQYYSSVTIEMVDDATGNIVHTANVAVDKTTNTFTHTFSPDVAANGNKTYSIKVKNTFGEADAQTIAITNTDTIPPTVVKDSQLDSEGIWSTPTAWSKLKDFIITATDEGSQIVDIKFQDVNNAGTGYNFTDNFGITSMDITKDPVTNNREYTFTGDVTGYVTAAVYLVDAAGNEKTEYLRIYNLDNTAPTINLADFVKQSMVDVNITDAGSGLRYFAVTESTQTEAPTVFGDTDTLLGDTLNQWYRVANNSDKNPEDTSGRNVNVTFANLKSGIYTFWAMDMLGNVSQKQFEVQANPLTTVWKIPANVDGTGKTTIELPIQMHPTNNYVVNWGDGTYGRYTTQDFPEHSYTNTEETTYTIEITGNVNSFGYYDEANAPDTGSDYYTFTEYVVGLESWGEVYCTRYGFAYCKNLSSTIPAPQEESFTNVVSMKDLFKECNKLSGSIPTGIFANATNVTDFTETFKNCQSLEGEIPTDLFETTTLVTSFAGTFDGCSGLKGEIPANLFTETTSVTSFARTFKDCSNLKGKIPKDLFTSNAGVTDYTETFKNCSSLEGEIPANLFTATTSVTSFAGVFNGCSNLEGTIPTELFASNTNATNFEYTFANCSKLNGHIPAELFANNTAINKIEGLFMNCSSIETAEISINTEAIENTNSMFTGCTSLESVAFSSDFEKLNGKEMFSNCTSLKAIILFRDAKNERDVPAFTNTETIGLPEQTIIYVPTKEAETVYENAYAEYYVDEEAINELTGETITVSSALRRIEPILGMLGENPVYVQVGETYTDAGYTVAGYEVTEAEKYTIYNLSVATSGLPVDTNTKGTKLVNYVLSHNKSNMMGLIRQVIVRELDFANLEVLMNPTSYEYDGQEKMPSVYVKLDGTELVEGTDYSLQYIDNKNAGTGKVKIDSMGIYRNDWTGGFEIRPRKFIITPEKGLVKFSGQEEPKIGYEYSNNVEGEIPIIEGELTRYLAGTEEGEVAGEYEITQGTLTIKDNGAFLASNYEIEITPEIITVIGDIEKIFITKWKVTAGETINLPIPKNDVNEYIVTWGDRTQNKYTTEAFPTHTYEAAGEYEINIYGVCKNYGYVGEQVPSETNIQKDYYSFTNHIVGIIQWGDISAERFGFAHCSNLTGAIPLTTGFSQITSMENMFYQCVNLVGPIPENFTADANNMTSARNLFYNCSSLSGSIPANTFAEKTEITTFEGTFQGCENLTGSIPETLFEGMENTLSYKSTFKNCSQINGYLPENLFADSVKVETFSETFANCTSITSEPLTGIDPEFEHMYMEAAIPKTLFGANLKARNYYRTFYNCTGLTGELKENTLIDSRIRRISNSDTSYTDYRGMFEGCTGIEKVSLGIVVYGKEMFKDCIGIKEIDLKNTLELGEEAFYACNNLKTITIDENYFSIIGKDAFEYTGTEPKLLLTKVNRDNEVLVSYEWLEDNRIVDVEAPKGTVKIEMEKDPFTNTQTVNLTLTVTDNYSTPENCEMAIINEDEYEIGKSIEDLKWQPFEESIEWELTAEDGAKVVYAYFKDEVGNVCESLDYIDGRIKIVSNTGSLVDNEPIEISLVSTFSGNNRQKNYSFRKEISVYRYGEDLNYQEYFNPVQISEEGTTYVAARYIETTTGIVIDETIVAVDIDTQKPEKVTYEVIRGTLNGSVYYGTVTNDGVLIKVTEGKDYNALGEESYGISEIRYSLVKDGEKIVEDESLAQNTLTLKEVGSYSVVITEVDVHGNYSEAESINVVVEE